MGARAKIQDSGPAAELGAKQRELHDAQIGQNLAETWQGYGTTFETTAESADAAAQAQASEDPLRGGLNKAKGDVRIEHALPDKKVAGEQAQGRDEFRTSDLGVGAGTTDVFALLKLPLDMQRVILGYVPLRDLARLACLCKDLRTPYRDRTQERDAAVTDALESHFTAEFRDGLTPAQTALPHDLIVDPPVRTLPLAVKYLHIMTITLTHLPQANLALALSERYHVVTRCICSEVTLQ
jgi:hypothetical protein